ncbi:pilus assembly PilX family protein [Thiovibrio frasassiensis]|uniref:Type 4 fimbrial biogenesis protein PilX N-terminal domain-containing protein n=1 Tax=Thiovibrio frasassiensis TaxID=2984131 RepID=A0A9X4RLU9_9BACT|nr:hypothetical protein [Thiovibrio frasassiensis]MDG4475730.1 hypothetical protein [Thiovibrio frasassiensis]
MIGQNEKGFVLVAAMVMLLIVLAIGIFASRQSNTETMISGVEKNYKENLYRAETAVFDGAQEIEDANYDALADRTLPGLIYKDQLAIRPGNDTDADGIVSPAEVRTSPEWDPATAGAVSQVSWVTPARYMCVDQGVPPGQKLSGDVMVSYMCYGKSQEDSGNVTIRIEFRKILKQ